MVATCYSTLETVLIYVCRFSLIFVSLFHFQRCPDSDYKLLIILPVKDRATDSVPSLCLSEELSSWSGRVISVSELIWEGPGTRKLKSQDRIFQTSITADRGCSNSKRDSLWIPVNFGKNTNEKRGQTVTLNIILTNQITYCLGKFQHINTMIIYMRGQAHVWRQGQVTGKLSWTISRPVSRLVRARRRLCVGGLTPTQRAPLEAQAYINLEKVKEILCALLFQIGKWEK